MGKAKASGAAKIHRSAGEGGQVSSVPSTEAQNSLGEILERVGRGERVFITRYGRRHAVLLSAEAYAELMGQEPVDMAELEEAFDERLRRMQTPEHAAATASLFQMSEGELGEAAAARADSEGSG
jgi:prevent-host-death family protein